MSAITDYVNQRDQNSLYKQQLEEQKKQNFWNNLLNVAKTGTDIWGAIQESQKYNPDSAYMKAQELANKTWPQQNAQFSSDLERGLWDYKLKNPGKTAEQLTQEWWLTPEGQAAQQKGWTRDDAVRAAEHNNRMAEIAAAQGGKGLQTSTWEAYKQALGGAQDAFLMRDEMGQPAWKPGINKDAVRKYLYSFIAMADAKDQEKLKNLFDAWIDFPTMGSTTQQNPISTVPTPREAVSSIATKAQNLVGANIMTGGMLAGAIPGAITAAGTAVGPAIGSAIGVGAPLYGAYEGAKALSGGRTTIPAVESIKGKIKSLFQGTKSVNDFEYRNGVLFNKKTGQQATPEEQNWYTANTSQSGFGNITR